MTRLFRSGIRSWMVIALLLVAASAALGCSGLDGADDTTTDSGAVTTLGSDTTVGDPGATTSTVSGSTATTVKVDASEELTSEGHIKACGIITEVWTEGSVRKLKIDYVDFLMGSEADTAAIADGFIAPGEHVDNDYYVRNNNNKLRTFTIANSVAIITYDMSLPPGGEVSRTWTQFYNFWNLVGPPLPADAGLSEGLWWIERIPGGAIVSVEQQWVP